MYDLTKYTDILKIQLTDCLRLPNQCSIKTEIFLIILMF